MNENRVRSIELDGDVLTLEFHYDWKYDVWHGDYPDFEEEPRFTPRGSPWVNVISDSCEYMKGECEDCGSCKYLKKEKPSDLIGICTNEKWKRIS